MIRLITLTLLSTPLLMGVGVTENIPYYNTGTTSQAAQFNWDFESEDTSAPRIGTFACGSYWVGPNAADAADAGVRVTSVVGDAVGNTDLITLDADPILAAHAMLALSPTSYGAGNAGEDEMPNLPKVFEPSAGVGTYISLVACKNRDYLETPAYGTPASSTAQVDAYNVITIVSQELLADPVIGPALLAGTAIRPPFISGGKREVLTWADFDLTRLPNGNIFTGTSISEVSSVSARWRYSTDVFASSYWDGTTTQSWGEAGRCYRPIVVTNDYGAGWAAQQANDMIGLMMVGEATTEQRKPAIAAFLAHGYDSWNARHGMIGDTHNRYSSGAGQWLGMVTSSAFFAALATDSQYASPLQGLPVLEITGASEEWTGYQEIRQTTRGQTGQLLWGSSSSQERYWSEFRYYGNYDAAVYPGGEEAQNRTARDYYGYIDGPPGALGDNYFRIDNAGQRAFSGVMLAWPEFRQVINTDRPIEFTHRAEYHGLWAYPDPVASPPPIDQYGSGATCDPFTGGFDCTYYRLSWGPDPNKAGFAIEDPLKAGRFTSIHGSNALVNTAYDAARVEAYFDELYALYDGATYEDWFTDLDKVVPPEIMVAKDSSGDSYLYAFCPTPFVEIRYTTDGSEPTNQSSLYSVPVLVAGTEQFRARAFVQGKKPSKISRLDSNYLLKMEATPEATSSTKIGNGIL